jgi:hypothetical protein
VASGDCIHGLRGEWCGDCNPLAGPASELDIWINHLEEVIPVSQPWETRWPSADELAWAAGLLPGQYARAIAAIRERFPDLPLVSDRNGIRFTLDARQVRIYREARMRAALTIVRRTFRGAVLPGIREISPGAERWVQIQAEHLLDQIEFLVKG